MPIAGEDSSQGDVACKVDGRKGRWVRSRWMRRLAGRETSTLVELVCEGLAGGGGREGCQCSAANSDDELLRLRRMEALRAQWKVRPAAM